MALFAIGLTTAMTSCSSDDDDVPVNVLPSENSLAGQQWTLVEGDETSVYTFLTETAMSVLVSPNLKAVSAPTTYEGTYSYDKAAASAIFNYNGRTRQLTDIKYGGNQLTCKIDGVPVTVIVTYQKSDKDKEFLESTAKEFVGLFNKDQFKSYTSIYNALEKSNANAVSDELEDVIDKLMKTTVEETSVLKHYRYVFYAAGVKGEYELKSDKKWYRNSAVADNVHRIIFNDADGRRCVVNVTTSGQEKEVYFYDSNKHVEHGYYDYDTWRYIVTESYTKKTEYRAMLPERIQATVTRGDVQLMSATVNVDLSSIEAGEKLDPSSDSFGMSYTLNIKDLVDITAYTDYAAQGVSKAGFTVKKDGRTILTASALANTALKSESLDDFDDNDKNNLKAGSVEINILGKIQLKGYSRNMSTVVNALDAKTDRYSYSSVKGQADKINGAMNVTMYYDGSSETRGWLSMAVDSKEVTMWNYIYNPSTQLYDYYSETKTKYSLTSAINFADGSSYFVEKYFTEDAFKSLVDQFNKLYDAVEDQL
jgi:hypothetical protein